jgi:AraC-like DNA-binding protein
MQRKTVSTDGVPRERRIAFWNAAAAEALAEQSVQPVDPGSFRGRMVCADIGALRLVEFSSEAIRVQRSQAHIARTTTAQYLLRLQLAGDSLSTQSGRDARLRAGDFTLCDVTRPYSVECGPGAKVLTLRVDRAELLRYIACPEALVHRPVSGTHGPGLVTSRLLREFWACSAEVPLGDATGRLSQFLLELLACAYADTPEVQASREPPGHVLRARAMAFIDAHLCDPDLDPAHIALALGVSTRYVHQLFRGQGQSVCCYIQRRRLERARHVLSDPRRTMRTITDVALEFGFKTLAHFSRCFAEEFGQGPREYRAQHSPDRH